MNEHVCHHEIDLGELKASVKHLEKEIDGNGQMGLSQTVPALSVEVKVLSGVVGDLRTAVSGLATFTAGLKGAADAKKTGFSKTTQILSLVIAFCGLLVAFIVMNNKTTVKVKNMVDQYGYDMYNRANTRSLDTIDSLNIQ